MHRGDLLNLITAATHAYITRGELTFVSVLADKSNLEGISVSEQLPFYL